MKKEIRIDELRVMMLDALALRGIGSEDADFIVDDFLDAELEGHKTHGVSKFLTIDIGLSGREGSIEIVSRTGGHAKIDGHRPPDRRARLHRHRHEQRWSRACGAVRRQRADVRHKSAFLRLPAGRKAPPPL